MSGRATGPGTPDGTGSGSGDAGPATVGDAVAGALSSLGVRRVHGLPLGRLAHVGVTDWDLAVLLADADGRLGDADGGGRLGAALLPGPVLHLSSAPGGRAPLQTVGSPEDLLDVLAGAPGVALPATVAVHLDLDLAAPAPSDVSPPVPGDRVPVLTLDPSMASLRLLAVVGPGVVRQRSLEGLRSFSRAAGAPVLASWGARGVEHWDSPYHAGICGLQARDTVLGGIRDADVVIAAGLDPDELGVSSLEGVPVQEVPAAQLGALCQRWSGRADAPRDRPSAHTALAPVLTPRYESTAVPLSPARAALHLSGALPDGGVAVADPGAAGFWVARAFPTSVPGSSCVPSTVEPGFAAAAALVAALDGRAALAVTDEAGATSAATVAVLDLARSLGRPLAVQCWDPGARRLEPDAHVSLLREQLADPGVRVDGVAVDLSLPPALVDLAGPVVAWGGGLLGGPGPGGGGTDGSDDQNAFHPHRRQ